uniref:Putative erythrocyte membrane protein n=1 Tax=Schistosoma mansoni TaxID=6183 RepID=A0A3Q0KNE5_SCHMA
MSNLYVVARLRPSTLQEFNENPKHYMTIRENEIILINSGEIGYALVADHRIRTRTFPLDHIFGSVDQTNTDNDSQASIYHHIGKPAVDSVKDGYNCSLFAYGMTGTGKTHTIFGSEEDPGLIPRICEALLNHIKVNQNVHTKYELKISFVEIYNEKIHDLLNSTKEQSSLRIREHPDDGPYVEGLMKATLTDVETLRSIIDKSIKNRTTAPNHNHEKSSRSHVICTLYYHEERSGNDFPRTINSKLCLIDLAGSERVHSLNDNKRFNEGRKINLSLSCLSTVIGKLAERNSIFSNDSELAAHSSQSTLNSTRSSLHSSTHHSSSFHIPYRNSKLTWLLRDSLGGNAHTTMIATISPSYKYYNETLNTLRYAQQAKLIKNVPKVNEDSCTTYIKQLLNEISTLKQRLYEKDYCTVGRYLDHTKTLNKRKTLLRKSSSEGSVQDNAFSNNMNECLDFKERTLQCESAKYQKDNIDTLTTSYAKCVQPFQTQNSDDKINYSQKFNGHDQQQQTCQQLCDNQSSLTVDQSTQTIQVEEYEKTCFDYLHRVELLNFFCNRTNRFLPKETMEQHNKCAAIVLNSNIIHSTNLPDSLLKSDIVGNTPAKLNISNYPNLFNGDSDCHRSTADYQDDQSKSDESDETDEMLLKARPLSSGDTDVDNYEKKEDKKDHFDVDLSKEPSKIFILKQEFSEDRQALKMVQSLSASTSTPKQISKVNQPRMRRMLFPSKLRNVSYSWRTFVKKRSKFTDKFNKWMNLDSNSKQRISNTVSKMFEDKNVTSMFPSNQFHLIKMRKITNLISSITSNELTSSLVSSTDLRITHSRELAKSQNEDDVVSVEHDASLKFNPSSLTTPNLATTASLSSPSSDKTTVSDLQDNSATSGQAVLFNENLINIQSAQNRKTYENNDSTDISLNLDDSLEEFDGSDTSFDLTTSIEVNKKGAFYYVQPRDIQRTLDTSLSSPSSIRTEDLSLEEDADDVKSKNEHFQGKIITGTGSLAKIEKYENLLTNIADKSSVTVEECPYTKNSDYNQLVDKEFSTTVHFKANLLNKNKRTESNSSNGYLIPSTDDNEGYINSSDDNSKIKQYSILKKHSKYSTDANSHLSTLQQLTTLSCLNAENIQLVMPRINELLQTDVLRSNIELFERLKTIHSRMQEVVSSNNPNHMLLLSINDRQTIYDGLLTISLVEKETSQTPVLHIWSDSKLTKTLNILQHARDNLFSSVHKYHTVIDDNNCNSNAIIINPQEFDQIKTTLLEITKIIKTDEKTSFFQDKQYLSDSIEEVINSLEKIDPNISNKQNSQINSEIIQHLENMISLNHGLIINHGIEAIKQNDESEFPNNRCVLKRQTAIDIATALQLIEDEYDNSVTASMTSDNKTQNIPNIDHLKYIHKSITKQLSTSETDCFVDKNIVCQSSDIRLVEEALTNHFNKINYCLKTSLQKEPINLVNTGFKISQTTHGNTVTRYQNALTPISEYCTSQTSPYEINSISNESNVKNNLVSKKQQPNNILNQMNQTITVHSNEENLGILVGFDNITIPTGSELLDLSTYIDDTQSKHDENSTISDPNLSCINVSDHFELENDLFVDSSMIAPIISYLKSKLLENRVNNLNIVNDRYSDYTINDVKQVSSYLVECLNANSEKPVRLNSTHIDLLNKLFIADQSAYSCILKKQLDLCLNLKETTNSDFTSEDFSVISEELSFLISNLREDEDIVTNTSFVENLCTAVTKYHLPILPKIYPCLSNIINNPHHIKPILNSSSLYKEKLGDELKQFLEALQIELQSENMIYNDILAKHLFHLPIAMNPASRLRNDVSFSSRPIMFMQTVISLYILDLFCSLPDEIDKLIYLLSIRRNFRSLVDFCELPSMHCSSVCTKLKSLFKLCTLPNESGLHDITVAAGDTNGVGVSQIISNMLPSIQVTVQATKVSNSYENQIENLLLQTRNKVNSKRHYFVNGEMDDITCGILITLTTIFTKGFRSLNPYEIAITMGKFTEFYHSLINSKCVKIELHNESLSKSQYRIDQKNLEDLNRSIYEAASDCLSELSEYKKMRFINSLILLGILLSQRRLHYNLTNFASAEANILISILLLFLSNFHINLQNTLMNVTKKLAKAIHNINPSLLLCKPNYISLGFSSHFTPVLDAWLANQKLKVDGVKSLVPYISSTNQLNHHLEICNITSSEVTAEKPFEYNHTKKELLTETVVDYNLYLHVLTLEEILSQSTTNLSCTLKVKPQNCKFLISCLSGIISSPMLIPSDIVKLTLQIIQEIHSKKIRNGYEINEGTSKKLITYYKGLANTLKEKYIKSESWKIANSSLYQTDENDEALDSTQDTINSNVIFNVVENKMKPTTWVAMTYRNKSLHGVLNKFVPPEMCLLNEKDDFEISRNSTFINDFSDQIVLFTHINRLKAILESTDQSEICPLNAENTESLFCMLETIKNQKDFIEILKNDQDFLSVFKLNVIQNCVNSTPFVINSKTKIKMQNILEKVCYAQFNKIENLISDHLRALCLPNAVQFSDQSLNNLILGQVAILAYSKQLNISTGHIGSLRDYCLSFQYSRNVNELCEQILPFANFLSNIINISDITSLENHNKNILYSKLEEYQEFYNRIRTSKDIVNSTLAYEILFKTIELEHLSRLYSLEIQCIPESLKCSLINMLILGEHFFPLALQVEEQIHVDCFAGQLDGIKSELINTDKVVRPTTLITVAEHPVMSEKVGTSEGTLLVSSVSSQHPFLNTTVSLVSKANILETTGNHRDPQFYERPLSTELNITENEEEWEILTIKKVTDINDSSFKSQTSDNIENSKSEISKNIKTATLIHEIYSDEQVMSQVTFNEIQKPNDIDVKLRQNNFLEKTINTSEILSQDNTIKKKILQNFEFYTSETDGETQDTLDGVSKNSDYLISVITSQQSEDIDEQVTVHELYSKSIVKEQDIDIKTASILISTIRSYLKLKPLTTIQMISLFSLLENINSQSETLESVEDVLSFPIIKLSSSDLKPLAIISTSIKSQISQETMTSCTDLLNYKIIYNITSYRTSIWKTESAIAYSALRGLLSSTTSFSISPSHDLYSSFINTVDYSNYDEKELLKLEQRLLHYYFSLEEQQSFMLTDAEIKSCKILLQKYEPKIQSLILQEIKKALHLVNQSNEYNSEQVEASFFKNVYYLILICLPNLAIDNAEFLRMLINLSVIYHLIYTSKNYTYCLKTIFNSYDVLHFFEKQTCLKDFFEVKSSCLASSSKHYMILFAKILERFVNSRILNQSLSSIDIFLLVSLLQIIQPNITNDAEISFHLKHLITRLLYIFITNQNIFMDKLSKRLLDDLCERLKSTSITLQVCISTEGSRSLDMIKNDIECSQSEHYQSVLRSLETVLFNPIELLAEPLRAKQIAYIIKNLNHFGYWLLEQPFIAQSIGQSLNALCDTNLRINTLSTNVAIIFQCIQVMVNHFNKNVIEPSVSQVMNKEDAAALSTSISWFLSGNLDFLSDIVDNSLEENVFINSPESWTNLMLLQLWYTSIACAHPLCHISQQAHSIFASELIKLTRLEVNRLIGFWKPRLDLYSQKQRTISIQKLSVSTECDLTAEMTNQELSNAIQLSLLSGQLNGPRSAWICVNVLDELQNECEHELISISNSEKESLRYALCSNTVVNSCELIPNTDIVASLVYLNSFLSKISSLTSSEHPELFLIQPIEAAPFASSIQNILKFTHLDIHRPHSFHPLMETEYHLWIASANLRTSWISNFECCLIDDVKQKALQIIFQKIRIELINLLNEFDEENFIKPNLTQIPIQPINRKNLSQLLRVSLLLNRYPVKHTITMLNHFHYLHDISCSVLPVQTVSYFRYFVSCMLTNHYHHSQHSYNENSVDITTLINSFTIDRLDSSLINCFFHEDIFDLNLPQDSMPIIQTSLVYCNTCEELINFLNILPRHCRQHLNAYLYQLFCTNLRKYTNRLLKIIMNGEEYAGPDINTNKLIPLWLHFLKHLIPKDIENQNKHSELLSVTTMSVDVRPLSYIYVQNERLKQLLVVNLNDLSSSELIQLIIDSDQFHHNLIYSKMFHEDLEFIPHLKYYLCNSLIGKLCNYTHLFIEDDFPRTILNISYEEIAMKLKDNISKILNNLSLDNDNSKICSLKSNSMESTNEIDENKSDIISDNLTNFSSCEDLLYPMEDVRPEINRLNHLLAINSLQPNEMSAILSSIVILRDASMHLPSNLSEYARFSLKEEDALNKLQMLIDQKTIVKLDKQLRHTLLLLSQRLGLLALQANKDLLRTGLEIWLNASLDSKLIFTKQQAQQIYYALYLAQQINNQEYKSQTDFCNTYDLVEQVILQLKPLVNSKFGAEIKGPHSLCPVVTLFIENAQQLLEQLTYSCKVSTNGISNHSFNKQKTTAENLWKLISCQSPEVIENELSNSIHTQLINSSEDKTDTEKLSKQISNKPRKTLKRLPEIDECNVIKIRQSYDRSPSHRENDHFQLNSHLSCDSPLSLLALYNEEKRRLLSWEEMTETRLRKACERVENLLRAIPEHTYLKNNSGHTVKQLREEVVLLKSQLHTMIKQELLKKDNLIYSSDESSVLSKKEQGNYIFDSSLYTRENQSGYQGKFSFDYIQLSERDTHRPNTSISGRLSSSTCSLKTFLSLNQRINQSYLVSCKPVTPDHVFSSPSNVDKRILQNSFDRLNELIEIRRAIVAGSREELRRLGIHSSLSVPYYKPFALIRPRDNKSLGLLGSDSHEEWLTSNQRSIDRRRNYTTHLCRSKDEYSRSNQAIEDLENKLRQLEEQILPHKFNGSVVQ